MEFMKPHVILDEFAMVNAHETDLRPGADELVAALRELGADISVVSGLTNAGALRAMLEPVNLEDKVFDAQALGATPSNALLSLSHILGFKPSTAILISSTANTFAPPPETPRIIRPSAWGGKGGWDALVKPTTEMVTALSSGEFTSDAFDELFSKANCVGPDNRGRHKDGHDAPATERKINCREMQLVDGATVRLVTVNDAGDTIVARFVEFTPTRAYPVVKITHDQKEITGTGTAWHF